MSCLQAQKKVLVCPLDWGWGHASRMIPIIHLLSEYPDVKVLLGLSGSSGEMLKEEFPDLDWIKMPSLKITYSFGPYQVWTLLFQLPKILINTIREHFYLKSQVKKEKVSCIVSDHRYGLFHKDITSILIIHQVQMKFPSGLKPFEHFFNLIQRNIFRKFDQVWIPDFSGKDSIAGELSNLQVNSSNFTYIGILSRFLLNFEAHNVLRDYFEIVVILSGPEPQRSFLEHLLTDQLKDIDKKVLLIKGIKTTAKMESYGNITRVSYLKTHEMSAVMSNAELVICRSGYSSVMDLLAMGKKAILIPTPGQTEQEYLGEYLMQMGYFFTQQQHDLDIPRAIKMVSNYCPPKVSEFSGELYNRIEWLMHHCQKKRKVSTKTANPTPNPQ
jgi:uncharacterized protein (TIGR00661 family)